MFIVYLATEYIERHKNYIYTIFDKELLWGARYELLYLFSANGDACACGKPLIYDSDNFKIHNNCLKPVTENCAICQENIKWSQPLSCGHCFHVECITHSHILNCPICRDPVKESRILKMQPAKEPDEVIQPSAPLHINDLTATISEILVEGVQLSADSIMCIDEDLLYNELFMNRIKLALLSIPEVLVYRNGSVGMNSISEIMNIQQTITLIEFIYSKCSLISKNRLLLKLKEIMITFMNEEITFPRNIDAETFGIIKSPNGDVRISTGNTKYERRVIDDIKLVILQTSNIERYKYIIKHNYFIRIENTTIEKSLNYIGTIIGTDLKAVYTLPLPDMTVNNILGEFIMSAIQHILKYFDKKSIFKIFNKYKDDMDLTSQTCALIFHCAGVLVNGSQFNIDNMSYEFINKFKMVEFTKLLSS